MATITVDAKGSTAQDMDTNALALEYKRDYGTASGNLNVLDLVNNPSANGVCCVFGLRSNVACGLNLVNGLIHAYFDASRPHLMLTSAQESLFSDYGVQNCSL